MKYDDFLLYRSNKRVTGEVWKLENMKTNLFHNENSGNFLFVLNFLHFMWIEKLVKILLCSPAASTRIQIGFLTQHVWTRLCYSEKPGNRRIWLVSIVAMIIQSFQSFSIGGLLNVPNSAVFRRMVKNNRNLGESVKIQFISHFNLWVWRWGKLSTQCDELEFFFSTNTTRMYILKLNLRVNRLIGFKTLNIFNFPTRWPSITTHTHEE